MLLINDLLLMAQRCASLAVNQILAAV